MNRNATADLAAIAGAGSAVVTDSLQLKSGLAAWLRPVTSHVKFCGRAVTVAVEPGDNRAAYEALRIMQPDDVLVISCREVHDVAMVGGTLTGHCRNVGAVGIVTDGMARDIEEIELRGLPVWARGIVPNAPAKLAVGKIGEPITIAGVTVATGDILVADVDGITVVPKCPPPEFCENLRRNLQREALARQAVERGDREPQWLHSIRAASGTR